MQPPEAYHSARIPTVGKDTTEELWAVTSIHDWLHRRERLIRSLVLFDRVLTPNPSIWKGMVSNEEFDRLCTDVDYLVREGDGAVRVFPISSPRFEQWQRKYYGDYYEPQPLRRDPMPSCRIRLYLTLHANRVKPAGVSACRAIPVHLLNTVLRDQRDRRGTTAASSFLKLLSEEIPVPPRDIGLQEIVELRRSPRFKNSAARFRRWQQEVLPEIIAEKDGRVARLAVSDFKRWTEEYRECLREEFGNRMFGSVLTFIGVGSGLVQLGQEVSIALLSAGVTAALQNLKRPIWKEVAKEDCAIAAIVYEAAKHL